VGIAPEQTQTAPSASHLKICPTYQSGGQQGPSAAGAAAQSVAGESLLGRQAGSSTTQPHGWRE